MRIEAGESGLIHAATGTGKTLAAWWGPLLEWLDETARARDDVVHAGRSRRRFAAAPRRRFACCGSRRCARSPPIPSKRSRAPLHDLGIPWTLESRTGDTPAAMRARQRKRLPTALVTTPESLSLLLTRDDVREIFADLRAVVVDEWHELLGTKRGVQVELALARVRTLAPRARTWGLSATIGNLEQARDIAARRTQGAATISRRRASCAESSPSTSSSTR